MGLLLSWPMYFYCWYGSVFMHIFQSSDSNSIYRYLLTRIGTRSHKKASNWEEYCVKRPLKIGFFFTCSGIEFEYLHELTQYVLFTLIWYQQLVLLLMIFSVGFSLCSSWVSYFGIMILVLWCISKVIVVCYIEV